MRQGYSPNKWQSRGNRPRRPGGGGGGGGGPGNRALDSNGPDVKLRGTASHICKKYQMLARDARAAGDRMRAENYLQHAEHYARLAAASEPDRAPRKPRPDWEDRPQSNGADDGQAFAGGENADAPAAKPARRSRQSSQPSRHPNAPPDFDAPDAPNAPGPRSERKPARARNLPAFLSPSGDSDGDS